MSQDRKRAVVLKHVEPEGPARIAELLRERQYEIEVRSLYAGDPVPTDLADEDLLIVMGGPMGVGDLNDPQYPFLKLEVELLRRRIAADAPVLGVCLGAQLLAHAAGASVGPMRGADGSRVYEVGWGPIDFERGVDDELTRALPARADVLHWHGDAFEIPSGAHRFASSAVCPNQAFRLGTRLFGLQFHVEAGGGDIANFIAADASFLTLANGEGAVARLEEQTARCLDASRAAGDALLRAIIDAMSRS